MGQVVVTVGSLHYDIMIDAPRLPRLGETLPGSAWRPKFGGKGGNQAAAAARAGAASRMAGAVGEDGFGPFLLTALDEAGVDRRFVRRVAGAGSGMSVAVTEAGGDYAAVIVSGANLAIDPADLADPALWRDAGLLLLQNEVPESVNLAAARAAHAQGASVLLNAAPARPLGDALAGLVDLLVVNAVEAEQMGGGKVADRASAARAALGLAERFRQVVVTAGAEGLAAASAGAETIAVPARPASVVSTHGAGDAFVGALAAAMVKGRAFADALAAANEAAAAHVSARPPG